MKYCPVCSNTLKPVKLGCDKCGLTMEGDFRMPRLARLSGSYQQLAESFLLSGGNLKDLASQLDVSYPTLRKRLDNLIYSLKKLQEEDEYEINRILDLVENKKLEAEEGMRLIKEIGNEL